MPSTKIEDLLDAEARRQADIDDLHEDHTKAISVRIEELLFNPGERDKELFELMGAPLEDIPDDYFSVPVFDRDVLWGASLSSLVVASRMQAWLEISVISTIEIAEQSGHEVNAIVSHMTTEEVKEAAIQGISKARIDGEKKRRQERKRIHAGVSRG